MMTPHEALAFWFHWLVIMPALFWFSRQPRALEKCSLIIQLWTARLWLRCLQVYVFVRWHVWMYRNRELRRLQCHVWRLRVILWWRGIDARV